MELTKYNSGIVQHIKHDLRQLPEGKSYGNTEVDSKLSHKNYSLIDRGKTAEEINRYRKKFEQECFKYNRKNLIHAVELCIQCPADCPPEQHEAFFKTSFDWYCNNFLPAGKDCVLTAQVHRDEHKYVDSFVDGELKKVDISKEHLHILYVPAIEADPKHPDFKYRLNADALTKRAILKEMHPSLQRELDEKGIQATVYKRTSASGKTIALSVKQLKEITNKTGVVIDHSLTVDELADVLAKNVEYSKTIETLKSTIEAQQKEINHLKEINVDAERSWGNNSWGNTNSWGTKNIEVQEEI